MRSCDFRRVMAVALVLTTTFVAMPLSAADFSTTRPVIGSVSAVGPVELRGLAINQEGTLFAGDSIRAGEKGYAKVQLGNGTKIELAEKTDVSVSPDGAGAKIAMNTGNVAFTAHATLRIDVQPFEILASDNAAGNIAVMSPTTAGIRALNGKVTVRNLKTSESFVITKGQERLLGLKDGSHAPSLAEVASNVPGPIPVPAPRPQTPAGKTGGGLALDTGAWIAVIAGAAVAGVAIAGLVIAHNNQNDTDSLRSDISSLNSSFTALQGTITSLNGSITTLRGQVTASNANISQLQTAVSALQSLSQVQSNAAVLQASILQAIQAVQASTLSDAQKASLIAGLNTQLAEANRQQSIVGSLAAGTPADIAARIGTITTLTNQANDLVPASNTAITAVRNAGVTVPTPPQLPVVNPPRVASASAPA